MIFYKGMWTLTGVGGAFLKSVIALKKSRGGVRRHTHTTIGRDNFPPKIFHLKK